jgi:hypothetical protein
MKTLGNSGLVGFGASTVVVGVLMVELDEKQIRIF